MNSNFYNELLVILDKEKIYLDEPMKKHTTFRVGGPADYFVTPSTVEEVKLIVDLCEKENKTFVDTMDKFVDEDKQQFIKSDNWWDSYTMVGTKYYEPKENSKFEKGLKERYDFIESLKK